MHQDKGWSKYQAERDNVSKLIYGAVFFSFIEVYLHLPAERSVLGKTVPEVLLYGPRPQAEGRAQDQGHRFSLYGPT